MAKEAPSDPMPRLLEKAGSTCRRKALPDGRRQEPEIQVQRELGGRAGGNGRLEGETGNPQVVLETWQEKGCVGPPWSLSARMPSAAAPTSVMVGAVTELPLGTLVLVVNWGVKRAGAEQCVLNASY